MSAPSVGVTELARTISAVRAEWGGGSWLDTELFGTDEPVHVAETIDAFCRVHLSSPIINARFHSMSVGSVHGVELEDGRVVVVKVHRSLRADPEVRAVVTLQQRMFRAGVAAPEPLTGPHPCGSGSATAERFLAGGCLADGDDDADRAALARGLSTFVRIATEAAASLDGLAPPGMLAVSPGALYPRPHSDVFDFEATARGAESIDEVARCARVHLDQLAPMFPVVVGHFDWRAQHVRLAEGRVCAIYDWDGVLRAPEAAIAGNAASVFTIDWSSERAHHAPTLEQSRMFVTDYEADRGRPFVDAERVLLGAAFAYSSAYSARCELADPVERPIAGSFRERIAVHGVGLLNL